MFFLPLIKDTMSKIMKIKNKNLAMLAAPDEIPPKPSIPATIARMIKTCSDNIGNSSQTNCNSKQPRE